MYSKKLKQVLIFMMIATSGALLVVFLGYRFLTSTVDKQIIPFENNANIALRQIHQTATRNGIMEWSLDAESAQYTNTTNQASFKNPLITFFLDNKKKVILRAKQGKLNTDSRDMMVSHEVTMDHEQYKLKADMLYYTHEKHIIYSDMPVELLDNNICIHADSMVFDLKTNQTRFKGHVEATILEPF
jgi:LPS export ABC transporter protein LptC